MPAFEAQLYVAPVGASAGNISTPVRFRAFGRRGSARWLIPEGDAFSNEVFLGWKPYRLSSRLVWSGMQSALRWPTIRRLLPNCETSLHWLDGLDWRTLGWERRSPPSPFVYLGTPGKNRKAVVHLINADSKCCELVVKVPLTEPAKLAIRREAHALTELEQQQFSGAPRLVALEEDAGIASQTVLPGSRCGLRLTREGVSLLQRLLLPGQSTRLRALAVRLSNQLIPAGDDVDPALLTSALEQIDDTTELPAARIHGDFAPWNIKLHNGSAALVDWEGYRPLGLPLHDAFHFLHMTRYLFGKRPRSCWQELRFEYSARFSPTIRRKLELAYLLQALAEELTSNAAHSAYLLKTIRLTLAAHP